MIRAAWDVLPVGIVIVGFLVYVFAKACHDAPLLTEGQCSAPEGAGRTLPSSAPPVRSTDLRPWSAQ